MRRYLVVAHKTLGGQHLLDELHRLREEDPYCTFHLIVPEHHPTRRGWTDHDVLMAARATLDQMLERLAEMRIGATGEVGDVNPVYAVGSTLRREGRDAFAGIILSTLPQGDLPLVAARRSAPHGRRVSRPSAHPPRRRGIARALTARQVGGGVRDSAAASARASVIVNSSSPAIMRNGLRPTGD